ncbi:hypothetical protein DFA_01320 [Cavenderia fasciculata]|uniref:UFSP1/2/DUB catalytic domain-containing protein n=1 Tax=Cavenderia fasciculata TaxID=261658 RepID=F4PS53_CACFS|nr:uncharacterized protein DFA_01320 [Cavenderia fasciculata]EGG21436.1 hypothetical protein DFA_01320 [Cavenderia fasciculata]|eukprot:XP_004359286.1 hypothetical protein DFA_01320 [Cavenderia fasciculata]
MTTTTTIVYYNQQIIERIKWIIENEEYKKLLLDQDDRVSFKLVGYEQTVLYVLPNVHSVVQMLNDNEIRDSIPFGLDIIGSLYIISNDDDDEKKKKEHLLVQSSSPMLIAFYDQQLDKIEFYDKESNRIEEIVQITNIQEHLNNQFDFIWVHSNTILSKDTIELFKSSKKDSIYFKKSNSKQLLSINTTTNQLKSLFEQQSTTKKNSTTSSSSSSTSTSFFGFKTVLELVPLFKVTTNDITNLLTPQLSLVSCSNNNNNNIIQESSYEFNRIVFIPKQSSSSSDDTIFNNIIKSILNQVSSGNIKYYQFEIPFIPFPITIGYEKNGSGLIDDEDDKLKSKRYNYHVQFGLPLDKPLLRSSKAYTPPTPTDMDNSNSSSKFTPHIQNIHLNLNLESKIGGIVSLVQGSYDYFHYLQDHFDDDGWGCAYRSMQTICSWLKYQDYTNRQVPTHNEIQNILVSIQDKPPSFYKSKQWIGAFEITLCLQNLYNIDCKIINVTSGSEVIYKARELARHFDRDGSPIMIGGGVLAYTLLGVDFNAETGDARYLILDPHYTGNPTDLKNIKDKGWCAWKGSNIFRKDAFYNFCLPQVPKDI